MKHILYIVILLISCSSCVADYLDEDPIKGQLTPKSDKELIDLMSSRNAWQSFGDEIQYLGDDGKLTDAQYALLESKKEQHLKRAYLWEDRIFYESLDERDMSYLYPYIGINIYNFVEEVISNRSEVDQNTSSAKAILAWAKTSRALAYFFLVNNYAQAYDPATASTNLGVVIREGSEVYYGNKDRATVQEVYDFMLADLTSSIDHLPLISPEFPSKNYHASKVVAYTLLSYIYLHMQDYVRAESAAINAKNIYAFLYDYKSAWGDGIPGYPVMRSSIENMEIIFTRYGLGNLTSVNPILLSPELEALFIYGEDDLRYKFWTESSADGRLFKRHANLFNYPTDMSVKTAMIYLNLAESKARNNDITGAMEVLDELLVNRFAEGTYVNMTATDQRDAINKVIAERRKELMFTGWRWYDQKRLNVDPETAVTVSRTVNGITATLIPGDLRYASLIPWEVINENSNITQNPR